MLLQQLFDMCNDGGHLFSSSTFNKPPALVHDLFIHMVTSVTGSTKGTVQVLLEQGLMRYLPIMGPAVAVAVIHH